MLLGLNDDGAEKLMNGGRQGSASPFYSMEKWSPNLRTGFRITWVQLWGILLQAWAMKYMQQIVAAMGDLVDIDDDAEDKRRLDRAWVLIKTPWAPMIRHTVDVHIGKECFRVSAVEECGGGKNECCRCCSGACVSSEERDSDETYSGISTPRSANFLGKEDDNHLITAPETTDPHRAAHPSIDGEDGHGTNLLPDGHRHCHSTLDKACDPRVRTTPGQDTVFEQIACAVRQPTVTSPQELQPDEGDVQCIGSAALEEGRKIRHEKGKCEVGCNCDKDKAPYLNTVEICEKTKEYGDVAETKTWPMLGAPAGNENSNQQGHHVLTLSDARYEVGECSYGKEIGPNRSLGFTNTTPTKNTHMLGFPSQNNNGAADSTCKVYSRQRWFKKKHNSGPIPPSTEVERGSNSLNTHQSQGLMQLEGNYKITCDGINRPATQEEATEGNQETQQIQEATNIWKMATCLGITGGDGQQSIINKLKEMEVRDKNEAERRGARDNCP